MSVKLDSNDEEVKGLVRLLPLRYATHREIVEMLNGYVEESSGLITSVQGVLLFALDRLLKFEKQQKNEKS